MAEIVILTGAGISADSGISTFRADTGLWANHRIEDVCTPRALARNPEGVHAFYNERRSDLIGKEPNAAHLAIAKLQDAFGDRIFLVTQNVDDLHERAGSRQVHHMHGELKSLKCQGCDHRAPFEGESHPGMICASCGRHALRPDIVFFEENPYGMDLISRKMDEMRVFIAIGTSGNVYPAAGLARIARKARRQTWLLNLEPPENHRDFSRVELGRAVDVVPRIVNELIGTMSK